MNILKNTALSILGVFLFTGCYAKSENFVVIIDDGAHMCSSPDTNSTLLKELSIGHLVKIISNSDQKIISDNKVGVWTFIDAEYFDKSGNETIKGWIPSYFIAKRKDFKRVNNFGSYRISGNIGDYAMDITFNKDGTFIQKLYGKNNGKYIKGYIYQKDKMICIEGKWLDGQDYFDFFYFDEKGNLLSINTESTTMEPIKAKKLDSVDSSESSNFFTLTGDNVNVRAEANTSSAALIKLSKGAKVTLLKRSDIALTVGGKKGFWAYIDTGVKDKKGGTIKGWVFDYYLKKAE